MSRGFIGEGVPEVKYVRLVRMVVGHCGEGRGELHFTSFVRPETLPLLAERSLLVDLRHALPQAR